MGTNAKRESILSLTSWDVGFLIYLFIVFFIYFSIALHLPTSLAPDEAMRSDIAYWIFEHHRLPVGNEPELLANSYGFSYATYPLLPAILSSVFMSIVSTITHEANAIFIASRMISVLSSIGSVFLRNL